MTGSDLEIVLLPDSDEYKKIEKDFLRSSQHKDVAPVQVVEVLYEGHFDKICHHIGTLVLL